MLLSLTSRVVILGASEDCALDGACGWVNPGNAVREPDVCPNLSIYVLELVQSMDLKLSISHLQAIPRWS